MLWYWVFSLKILNFIYFKIYYLNKSTASQNGKDDIVNALIHAKANLNIQDNVGNTALIQGIVIIFTV